MSSDFIKRKACRMRKAIHLSTVPIVHTFLPTAKSVSRPDIRINPLQKLWFKQKSTECTKLPLPDWVHSTIIYRKLFCHHVICIGNLNGELTHQTSQICFSWRRYPGPEHRWTASFWWRWRGWEREQGRWPADPRPWRSPHFPIHQEQLLFKLKITFLKTKINRR